jgi:hypothetical protein
MIPPPTSTTQLSDQDENDLFGPEVSCARSEEWEGTLVRKRHLSVRHVLTT